MTDLLTTPELVSETVKEPAKRWRNWWCSSGRPTVCLICDARRRPAPGEVFADHCRTFPSKDAAETRANEIIQIDTKVSAYLGAYPEGERP